MPGWLETANLYVRQFEGARPFWAWALMKGRTPKLTRRLTPRLNDENTTSISKFQRARPRLDAVRCTIRLALPARAHCRQFYWARSAVPAGTEHVVTDGTWQMANGPVPDSMTHAPFYALLFVA